MKKTTSAALTVKQVAGLLNVDSKTVYRLVQRAELPGFKVAGAWRFLQHDIDHWIGVQKASQRESKEMSDD